MKSYQLKLFTLTLMLFLTRCSNDDKNCGCEPHWQLYKLRGNYIENVCVMMDKEKTRIKGYPSTDSNAGDTSCHPLPLINGYYLDQGCNYGVNSAYLTITREEFINWIYEVPADSYKNYILDKDPYLEYYISNFKFPSDTCDLDTLCLNNLIRNNTFEIYFDRIK